MILWLEFWRTSSAMWRMGMRLHHHGSGGPLSYALTTLRASRLHASASLPKLSLRLFGVSRSTTRRVPRVIRRVRIVFSLCEVASRLSDDGKSTATSAICMRPANGQRFVISDSLPESTIAVDLSQVDLPCGNADARS